MLRAVLALSVYSVDTLTLFTQLRRAYRVCQVNGDTDILQHLLLHCVGALELEHGVGGEDVLDGHNVVLRLLFSQLNRLTALEEPPIAGKLRHLTSHTHNSSRFAIRLKLLTRSHNMT